MSLPLISRRFVIRCALLLAGSMVSAQASRPDKRAFNISAAAAPVALAEFVQQSGLQVLFDFDAIRGFKTHAVSGRFDPAEALALMFEGIGLTFEFVNERTVSVRPVPPLAVRAASSDRAS